MENFTNGDVNTYTMTTKSPLPHFNGDIFQFRFPYQILVKESTVCTPLGALKAIDCRNVDGHLIEAEMTFYGDFLEKDSEITFLFLELQNSPDTRLSDIFREVEMIDPTRYLLTQYKGTTTLQTLYFATV